jgi:multiple sugar transport system permease protein
MSMTQSKTKQIVVRALLQALCVIFLLICLLPIWLLIVNTTRSTGEIQTTVSFIPGINLPKNWSQLGKIMEDGKLSLVRAFLNSGIISVATVILSVGFSALFAFVFTVYEFRFKKQIFAFVLFIIMVPSQLGIIGLHKQMADLRLLDTYVPLIAPTVVSATTIFFLTQYYQTALHKEIVEAARIDGANELFIFFRIALPLGAPALATMGIAVFIESWNAYNLPNIMLFSNNLKTLPQVVAIIRNMGMDKLYMTDGGYGAVYLSVIISILPLILVFIIFSKSIVNGVSVGGVKE